MLLHFKKLTFFIFLIFVSFRIMGQVEVVWAKKIGGTSWADRGNSIALDNLKNVYITGVYNSSVDFDPGPGTATLTSIVGWDSPFLAKYDSSGNYIWAYAIPTNSGKGIDVKIDNDGNIVLIGFFSGLTDFDPGSGVANLSSPGTDGGFIAKYDPNGNYIWAKNIYANALCNIVTDTAGNIYTAGTFTATKDFDPGPGVANLIADPSNFLNSDVFFAKYDKNGNYIMAKAIEGRATVASITQDKFHNILITGDYSFTVDFDPDTTAVNGLTAVTGTSSYEWDAYFAKYDANGNYLWAKGIGAQYMDQGSDVQTDTSGNVYLTGVFTGTVDFDPSAFGTSILNSTSSAAQNTFFARYDANGNYVWAKVLTSEVTHGNNPETMLLDAKGNIYLTGHCYYDVDADPGPATYSIGGGRYQVFIARYDSVGNFVLAAAFGSFDDDYGHCIALDQQRNLFVIGDFTRSVNFGVATNLFLNSTSNTTDIFFAKYAQPKPANALIIYGTATVCAGQMGVSYTAYPITGASSYNWTLPPGATFTGSTNTQTITVNFSDSATTGSFSVYGINSMGAGAPISYSVTVTPKPPVAVTFNDTTICSGTSVTLHASGAGTYSWLPSSALTGGSTANPTASPLSTITYTVTGTLSGCTNTASILVTVPHLITSGNISICEGSSGTLTANGYDSITWSTGQTGSLIMVNPLSDTVYTVMGSTLTCTDSSDIFVSVNPVSTTTVSTSICSGEIYTINSHVYSSSGTYNDTLHTFHGCDSIIITQLNVNSIYSVNNPQSICDGGSYSINGNVYTAAGTYNDTLYTLHGCDSIIVTQLNVNGGYSINNPQSICNGESYSINGNVYTVAGTYQDTIPSIAGCDSVVTTQLIVNTTDNSINATGTTLTANLSGAAYQWIDCDNGNIPFPGETNQSYTAIANGNYAVIISYNSCIDTSSCYPVISTSVLNGTEPATVKIFPVPGTDEITVMLQTNIENAAIRLFNSIGQAVLEKKSVSGTTFTLNIAELDKGIYHLEINCKDSVIKAKVIKN